MNTRPRMNVWAVRRDGWMRRMQLDLPLPREFHIAEKPADTFELFGGSVHAGPPPEGLQFKTLRFQLMEIGNSELMPWGEPCFYKEI